MKKNIYRSFTVLIFALFLLSTTSNAQFEVDKHHLGPSLGFYFHGSSVIFGANYEYGMQLKDIGKIGVGGIVRYYSYDAGWWTYSDILIGAQGNYHFNLDNKKLDPWLGLLIAFDIGSVDYDGPNSSWYSEPSYGGFWVGLHGGMRYWIDNDWAIVGRFGFGSYSYSAFDVGVDFKF